ncbi:hypothetical protein Plec18167_003340 [Paecilomyces lecythidis]|uniref:Xylose isomerase-like TIM barrel domain-containing protein n=1 Tax=Paecilomyces lecythidis TaxID=3004212 RepID=A0ABR3Y1I6_9EURO
MSLGRAAVHELPEKISQAARAGFKGVEIFYEDLEYAAKAYGAITPSSLYEAARTTRKLCDANNLKVISLQPFMFYEGLTNREEHQEKIKTLKIWFQLVKILGTDLILIPSNFATENVSGDMDLIVQDMIEVADLGLQENPPVRFAYESLAWGTYIDTWERSWEVVQRVNRSNFGSCLDTFNIVGRVWADPASPTGKTPNADEDLKISLERLRNTVDIKKVFLVQLVDGERMQSPLLEGHPFHVDGQPPRMSWSRNARLFPYEQNRGGYMPVVDVARVILKDLGYRGWVSMELFSRTMWDPQPSVPSEHAQRGIRAWDKLQTELVLPKRGML